MANDSVPGSSVGRSWRRGHVAAAVMVVAVVVLADVWLVSAGSMRSWYCYTAYYDLLGDAFRHGQLHLRVQPHPALFTLADPYDPFQNQGYRLHDALLYGEQYYFYNGPAPALFLAAFKFFCSRSIGDQLLTFLAALALPALTAVLLEGLRRTLYPRLSPWMLLPGVLVAALAHPLPLLLGRAAIYEAALSLAQVALLAGLTALFFALARSEASLPPRRLRLLAAGFLLALAPCTRASLAPAVAALGVLTAWRLHRLHRAAGLPLARFAGSLTFFAVPLLLGAAGHAAYNQVRFGSWHEFGIRYQLAGYNIHAVTTNGGGLTSQFVAPNLYAFILHRPGFCRAFPYVAIPPVVYHGAAVHGEPIGSAAWTIPYLWLALLPVLLLPGAAWPGLDERTATRNWVVLCLLAAGLGSMAPDFFLDGCANRYLGDAVPSLLVLATLGGWEVLSRLQGRPMLARLWVGAVCACTLATVAFGFLLGAYYVRYTAHHRTRVPSEWYPYAVSTPTPRPGG